MMADSTEMSNVMAHCFKQSANRTAGLLNQTSTEITVAAPVSMFIAGVIGNILALVVLYSTTRVVRKTVFFVLLAGLAWSDLFSTLMTSPVTILIYANNLRWVGGDPLCVYHAFVMICFGTVTPLLVLILSLERLLALQFTYFYGRVITRRTAKYIFLACWLFVISFSCLPFVGLGSFQRQYPGSWCFLNFHHESSTDAAYAYMFAFFNASVILASVCINIVVVMTLLHMRRRRRLSSTPSVSSTFQPNRKPHVMEMETRMVWFLCAITTVFVICWLPLNVHIIINQITGQIACKRDLLFVRLASINQILDPWMYILLRQAAIAKIARALKSYICCCCPERTGMNVKILKASPSLNKQQNHSEYSTELCKYNDSFAIHSDGQDTSPMIENVNGCESAALVVRCPHDDVTRPLTMTPMPNRIHDEPNTTCNGTDINGLQSLTQPIPSLSQQRVGSQTCHLQRNGSLKQASIGHQVALKRHFSCPNRIRQ